MMIDSLIDDLATQGLLKFYGYLLFALLKLHIVMGSSCVHMAMTILYTSEPIVYIVRYFRY